MNKEVKNIVGLYTDLQPDGGCISSILYTTKIGSWADNQEINVNFQVKSFYSKNEKETKDLAIKWVKANIDSQFSE